MTERLIYNTLIGLAIPLLAEFLSPLSTSADFIWMLLSALAYAFFLESYRCLMRTLNRGQLPLLIGSLTLISLLILSHLTLQRLILLLALAITMIHLFRSMRRYSTALSQFKEQLQASSGSEEDGSDQ